jgi:hypothetical protein
VKLSLCRSVSSFEALRERHDAFLSSYGGAAREALQAEESIWTKVVWGPPELFAQKLKVIEAFLPKLLSCQPVLEYVARSDKAALGEVVVHKEDGLAIQRVYDSFSFNWPQANIRKVRPSAALPQRKRSDSYLRVSPSGSTCSSHRPSITMRDANSPPNQIYSHPNSAGGDLLKDRGQAVDVVAHLGSLAHSSGPSSDTSAVSTATLERLIQKPSRPHKQSFDRANPNPRRAVDDSLVQRQSHAMQPHRDYSISAERAITPVRLSTQPSVDNNGYFSYFFLDDLNPADDRSTNPFYTRQYF